MNENFDKFRQIISEELQVNSEKIILDSNFQNDLGADSLDVIELLTVVEKEYSVKLENEDLRRLISVRDAYNLLQEKQIEKKGS